MRSAAEDRSVRVGLLWRHATGRYLDAYATCKIIDGRHCGGVSSVSRLDAA